MRPLPLTAILIFAASCSSKIPVLPPPKYKVIGTQKTAEGERAMTVGQTVGSYHSRSKGLEKLTGGELQKLFAKAKAADDLTSLSILIEESFNPNRSNSDIVPILGALLADDRKAVLAVDDATTSFLEYKVGNDIKTIDVSLSLYAAWHLQSRLKVSPGDIYLHCDRVYYAQHGNFAVASEPVLAAWRKWWQDKRQDYEDVPNK